jgi:hypothetical protein
MMRYYILAIFASLTVFISCKEDYTYFHGKTVIIDVNVKPDTLYGKKIALDGIYTGNIWAYDTLIGFMSYKFPDYHMHVFNVNTGEFLYPLCRRGTGPGEFPGTAITDQLVYDEQIHYWIRKEFGRDECVLLNLEKPGDVVKQTVDMNFKTEFQDAYGYVFILNDSLLLGCNYGERQYQGEGTFIPPTYYIYNYHTKEKIETYRMYNGFIPVPGNFYNPMWFMSCYQSCDRIKPDNSKLAMGMCHMDQINILDLRTGELKGYRNKTSPDFSYLREPNNYKLYYTDVFVDERYVYGWYHDTGNSFSKKGDNIINVFDWDGNFIRKILLDKPVLMLTLDPVNKYLYADVSEADKDEEEIYCYDLSYLYK